MSYVHSYIVVGVGTEEQPRENYGYVVTLIHYLVATKNLTTNNYISTFHTVYLPPPNFANFIEFSQLTNKTKIQWVKQNIDVLAVETENIRLLELQNDNIQPK